MSAIADLAELPVWVAWQLEMKDGAEPGSRPDKIPYRIGGGRAASNDPRGWGTRDKAAAMAQRLPRPYGGGGVGIVLTEIGSGHVLCGIDLDTCRDQANGHYAPWAQEVVEHFESYTEISPSQTGFKVFFTMTVGDCETVRAEIRRITQDPEQTGIKWARGGGAHPPAIELFTGGRYFTVTEQELGTYPLRVVTPQTVFWVIHEAGPQFRGNGAARGRVARDDSRSGIAYRKGLEMRRAGASKEEIGAALEADLETADWVRGNGGAGGRGITRIWKKAEAAAAGDNTWPYSLVDGALRLMKDGTPVKLANFAARITEQQTIDDGVLPYLRYRIEATLQDGTPLPPIPLPTEKFQGGAWVDRHWGARAQVSVIPRSAEHLCAAIKKLSSPAERRIYTHIGWRRIDGRWVYLHAGGAIGADGPVGGVEVEPDGDLAHYLLPPVRDIRAAVRSSLALLDMGLAGTALAAAAYRAPLAQFKPVTCTVWLTGPTGMLKSAITFVAQAHWGTHWARRAPVQWSSTANALEKVAFGAKDAVCVIDSFDPNGTKTQVQSLHSTADRVIRAQGNQSGRSRMNADTSLKATYVPRGIVVGSGEDIPAMQSLRARMFIVNVAKGDVDLPKLTALQKAADEGRLAEAMAGYVRWLAAGAETALPGWLAEPREMQKDGGHLRNSENVASLAMGLNLFLKFAEDVSAIEPGQWEELYLRAVGLLEGEVAVQKDEQHSEDPVERFLGAVGEALAGGRAHVATREGKEPNHREACGWGLHQSAMTSAEKVVTVWKPARDLIGWVDIGGDPGGPNDLWLLPGPALAVVNQMLRDSSGRELGLSDKMLGKRLKEAGQLVTTNPDRHVKSLRAKDGAEDGREDRVRKSWHLRARDVLLLNAAGTQPAPKMAPLPEAGNKAAEGLLGG